MGIQRFGVEMPRLLFIVNVDWFFISHRLPIAVEAVKQGYEVHIATTVSDGATVLEGCGMTVHPLNLHRSRVGVVRVLVEFFEILLLVSKVAPDILHLITIKPVLLGGIAARLARVPAVVTAISGLGFVFVNRGRVAQIRRYLISLLYRLALGRQNQKIIFQNVDDQAQLSKLASLSAGRSVLIHGSGVDLSLYLNKPMVDGVPIVLLAARLLVDKGVREFVAAAELVNRSEYRACFVLVGEIDPLNPASIQQDELDRWKKEGFFCSQPIRKKWDEHLSGRRNWHHHLWDVLMFQAWLEAQS